MAQPSAFFSSTFGGPSLLPGLDDGLLPPLGYAFVLQNNKIVTQAGKPVVIRKAA